MTFFEWLTAQLDALRAMVSSDDSNSPVHATATSPIIHETKSRDKLELAFQSDTASLSPVRRAIESFAADSGLDASAREEVGLVVNEALANVIRHAYNGQKNKPVKATIERYHGGIKISLRDWGNGVDPTLVERPPHDPLTPGGLGLICLKRLMDDVSYQKQPDGMLLVMTRTTSGSRSCPDDKREFV
jgi:serine/threonine-protein kinase RsbW